MEQLEKIKTRLMPGLAKALARIAELEAELKQRVEERTAELQREIVEHKRLEEALTKERDLLRTLIDAVPDRIYAKDTESRFITCNKALIERMGKSSAAEIVGQSDFDLVPKELAERTYADEQMIIQSGQPVINREEPLKFKDGKITRWNLASKVPLRDSQGNIIGIVGLGREITEFKQAKIKIEQNALQLRAAAEVSRATTSILNLDELLPQAVELIRSHFDLYYTGLFLVDQSGEMLVLRAGTGEAGRKMIEANHKLKVDGQSMVGWCVTHKEARLELEGDKDAVRYKNPLLPGTRSELVLPLISRGEAIGAMTVQSEQESAFSEDDITILQTLADQLTNAIENARLFRQVQQRAIELAQAKEAAEKAKTEAEAANQTLAAKVWQNTGQALLNEKMQGEQDVSMLANNVIQQLCKYIKAPVGTLYVLEDNLLKLAGSYAYTRPKKRPAQFQIGESLVGQAALEKQPIVISDVADNYIAVTSSLGEMPPRNLLVAPSVYNEQVVGVVEIGALTEFTPAQLEFIETTLANIAIALNTAQARTRINELLAETQQQAEELQAQGEELRVANEELESQTKSLRVSEAKLKEKQAELEATNTQLEEKAAALEESSEALREKQLILDKHNQELKVAQQELAAKAEELALASKYKSEFLANMSHELRTPLNSSLILARMLADNEKGNLTQDQVESAQIIYSGGIDLLNLINDILDLSKVEAGQMIFNFAPMPLTDLVADTRIQFEHMAEEKGVALRISLADDLPEKINTDPQRVKQIVKNLLSNAFKFTGQGSVSLNIYRPDHKTDLSRCDLDPGQAIAISVADTGIGMTSEQQKIIFEAFQQADGSTSRLYGGTGLGLSISRELADKLGGQIDVESEPGRGSTFTLYLPIERQADENKETTETPGQKVTKPKTEEPKPISSPPDLRLDPQPDPRPAPHSLLLDDRDKLGDDDKILLIIEDDPKFAKIMVDYAHGKAFKCLVAGDGKTGLELVNTYQPAAIILDLNLPDISGWEVLGTLKNNPATRHIPVHIMSVEEEALDAYRKGAMGYLTKPTSREDLDKAFQEIEHFISKEIRTLLLVEDDANSRRSIKKLLNGSDVKISEAEKGRQALDLLQTQHFDCMILDLNLPDMSGFEVLNKIKINETITKCPVIVYTGRDLTPEENIELMKYADRVIVKGVMSPERLVDETALFLHRVVAEMPKDKQQTIKQLYNEDGVLKDKRVLIVDDDMRNSFALSKLLSDKGLIVKIAQNGQKALDLLAEEPVNLVLMDIMMPVMDGYETTKRIRAQPQFRTLPILALTAKAMKGDREKCLAAGANDYLPKPIDVDRLFSMLRVWLYQ
ncbi:MAG: response regulator [Anaerolineae bacterium]|nr:response regulator [Anaerolineae bacterium]